MKALFARRRTEIILFFASLALFCAASNRRMLSQSRAIHFVYLADSILKGRLSLDSGVRIDDDLSKVETLTLKDGRVVRGQFAAGSTTTFRTTSGKTVATPPEEIASRKAEYYVSFPPFPAVLMLPVVALSGLKTNDVLFTLPFAAAVPPLLFALLCFLRERGYSRRTDRENLWLTALFAIGSVFFYSSVIGEVWYTAHVIGCLLTVLYVLFAIEARRPALAGLCLGLAVATRAPLFFMFPLFAFEAWRFRRSELVKVGLRFAAPAAAIGIALALFNYARFDNPFEFGHTYLVVRWSARIQRWGLFNYHFLARNLAAAFTLTPKLLTHAPFLQTSRHGMSMLITTPALLYLLWPRKKPPIHRALWATVLLVALQSFLYQNDGFVQFGYRFSLDYMVFLTALLAIGARPLTRTFQGLILFGVVVNLLGALSFNGLGGTFFYEGFFPAE